MQDPEKKKIENEIDEEAWQRAKFIADLLEKPGTVSVRIKKPIYDKAKELCSITGVSVNDYVSAAVAQRLWWEKNR
mgnify:CR=1 FL=1